MNLRQPTITFADGVVRAHIGRELVGVLSFVEEPNRQARVVDFTTDENADVDDQVTAALQRAVTDELGLRLIEGKVA